LKPAKTGIERSVFALAKDTVSPEAVKRFIAATSIACCCFFRVLRASSRHMNDRRARARSETEHRIRCRARFAVRLPERDDGERTTRIANATRDAFTVRRRTRL